MLGAALFEVSWLRREGVCLAVANVVNEFVLSAPVVAPASVEVAAGGDGGYGAELEDSLGISRPHLRPLCPWVCDRTTPAIRYERASRSRRSDSQ